MNNLEKALKENSPCKWVEILAELLEVIESEDNISLKNEILLLHILNFNGKLNILDPHECPHSMSPVTMLKFLTIQYFGKNNMHQAKLKEISNSNMGVLASAAKAMLNHD